MSENKKSKNEITTDTVLSVYKLLNDSKLTKMEDKDKGGKLRGDAEESPAMAKGR